MGLCVCVIVCVIVCDGVFEGLAVCLRLNVSVCDRVCDCVCCVSGCVYMHDSVCTSDMIICMTASGVCVYHFVCVIVCECV